MLPNRIIPVPKQGSEELELEGRITGWKLSEFWRWSSSDLVSNATRGKLAEFIIAKALNISTDECRGEWAAFDLKTRDGIDVEVKSAAYIQSWSQRNLSKISFSIRKTREWNAETNIQAKTAKRQADVYVFALLHHQDRPTINPLNIDQWSFFVLSTKFLDKRERSAFNHSTNSYQIGGRPIHFFAIRKESEGGRSRRIELKRFISQREEPC
jgi:hypothetical protein